MALASLTSELGAAAGVLLVLGMAGMLVYRATRKRAQDEDPEDH